MSVRVVLLELSWLNPAPPVVPQVCSTSDSSPRSKHWTSALFRSMVRLTSDIAEDGKPLPSEGESQADLRGRDLCVLLPPVRAPVVAVLPLTGAEGWPGLVVPSWCRSD